MKLNKIFSVIVISLIIAQTTVFADTSSQLNPEKTSQIQTNETGIAIRTNVTGASVYLNDVYKGEAPITFSNLTAGRYSLRVEKKGYAKESYSIFIRNGEMLSYYVHLEKVIGWLVINGAPQGSEFYIDGVRTFGMPLEVEQGFHNVTVKCFGYNEYSTTAVIAPRFISTIDVTLSAAQFALSQFNGSRRSINPEFSGMIGECNYSFHVTAPQSGTLTITNSEGSIVYTKIFPQFTTWEQSVTWNGRDSNGYPLPDGTYKAVVSAGGSTQSIYTSIDHSITMTLADFNTEGIGIGTLPVAFSLPANSMWISIGAEPVFRVKGSGIYDLQVPLGAGYVFGEHTEFSIVMRLNAFMPDTPIGAIVNLKFFNQTPILDGSFQYALTLHYGGISTKKLYAPYSIYVGNGLGGNIAFGFSNKRLYAGLSSEYELCPTDGSFNYLDHVWRNGITLQARATNALTFNTWCALNSSFNMYDESQKSTTGQNNWFRAIDTGISSNMLLGSSSFMLGLKAQALIFFEEQSYISGSVTFSYLF